jgi:putative membrane protein
MQWHNIFDNIFFSNSIKYTCMKKISMLLATLPVLIAACNNSGGDSVKAADSANSVKADSSSGMQTMAADKESAEFMVKAADGGKMEVELGKLAQQKAKSQRVKDFGAMMVRDHSKGGDELKSLAVQKNVTMPDSLSNDHRKHVTELGKKSGVEFDKAYINMMVDDHKDDIDEFQKASKNATDKDVKAFAEKTLPVLMMHLDSAKAIQQIVRY